MPLILVQNEVTEGKRYDFWEDIEGVQYHFPNKYKNKIKPGESFIYYRGVRRKNGIRAIPEYFGYGRIGRVWQDKENITSSSIKTFRWQCEIIEYIPFTTPVPFKINGRYFEILHQNQWSIGVRSIDQEKFIHILSHAGITIESEITLPEFSKRFPCIPEISDVSPELIKENSLIFASRVKKVVEIDGIDLRSNEANHSRYSTLIGNQAEEIAHKFLLENRFRKVKLVSKEKLGWDIEYLENKKSIFVEVKGTSARRFSNIPITANEWQAAKRKRETYKLILVAECLSRTPKIQIIDDPYSLYLDNKIDLEPTTYRLGFLCDSY